MAENNINNPTSPTPPNPTPELPDLAPAPSQAINTSRNFTPSDPNLKPLEVGTASPTSRPINTQSVNQNSSPTQNTTNPARPVPTPSLPPTQTTPPTIPTISTPNEPEIFVNPSPPPVGQILEETIVTPSNPLGINQNPPSPPQEGGPSFGKLLGFGVSKTLVLGIITALILLTGGGFAVNEFVINKITTLKLVSDSAEFYLSLAVKQNPQAQKAKDLIKKLPGSDTILKDFDKTYTDFVGSPNDPLVDAIHYANQEIFLARISRSTDNNDTSQHLLAIVDAGDTNTAKTDVGNFADDTHTYKTASSDYNGTSISSVQLKSEVDIYEQTLSQSRSLKYNLNTPKPKSTYIAALDHYLAAAQNQDDLKKTADLAKAKTVFGFGGSDSTKTVLNDTDHQEIATNFPANTFIKYFARQPLTPSNTNNLNTSASGVTTAPQSSDTETRTFQKVSVGVDAEMADDGATVHSYSLDWFKPQASATNTFKISDSLASQLPKTFAGVSPTLYVETKDLKGQWKNEKDMATKLANSDNRTQRQQFQSYLDGLDSQKKEFKNTYGIDYESDLLNWMDGQVAFAFNAGSAKKAPEGLLIAGIKDKTSVLNSLNKFKMPNFTAQMNDATRKSDLTDIASALRLYYYDTNNYPTSLSVLASNYYTYGISSIPKDPETGKDYAYSVTPDKKSYTLAATLADGTTLTVTNTNTSGTISGTKKDTTLTAEKTTYNGVDIYKTKLYSYQNITFYLVYVVTDKKAIIAFTDSDQSIKGTIDFEKSPGEFLTKNNAWQKQFSSTTQPVEAVSFIEPIQLWGLVDYLTATYPDYKKSLTGYTVGGTSFDDLQTAAKAYLKTFSSIGTIMEKKQAVYVTTTFVNVVELPGKEKQNAEDAINRLNNSYSNSYPANCGTCGSSSTTQPSQTYKPILGINTQNFGERAKSDLTKLYNLKIKPFLFPESFLTK